MSLSKSCLFMMFSLFFRQCGKPFKPEKLHAHMKSCKGMKALSKEAAAISAEKGSSRRSVDLKTRESVSGHLLTQ